MASELERLVRSEHPRPGIELVLALAVIEPRIAAGTQQEQVVAGADGQRLGDSSGLDAERFRGGIHCRRGSIDLDEPEVGRVRR
jgi:hypothetical protein